MYKIRFGPLNHESKSSAARKSRNTVTTGIVKHEISWEITRKAGKMFLPKSYCLSWASASLTPTESLSNFPDHYLCMQLDHWCTAEEIKLQYRKLRVEYFASEPSKYHQLQAAYSTLVDPESRRQYDAIYRVRIGLPPPSNDSPTTSFNSNERKDTTAERPDNLLVEFDASPHETAIVKAAVAHIEAQAPQRHAAKPFTVSKTSKPEATRLREEQPNLSDVIRPDGQCCKEKNEPRTHEADPNWGLKHLSHIYKPLIGSKPYHSYIPIAEVYKRGNKRKCHRPVYVRKIAAMALP